MIWFFVCLPLAFFVGVLLGGYIASWLAGVSIRPKYKTLWGRAEREGDEIEMHGRFPYTGRTRKDRKALRDALNELAVNAAEVMETANEKNQPE